MVAIERGNPRLKGILPVEYARPTVDRQRLGELIDMIGTSGPDAAGNRSKDQDLLGRVYESCLAQFAGAEGENGGQFSTPRRVVRALGNGGMRRNPSGKGEICKTLIDTDLVDCMVTLPGQIYCSGIDLPC